MLAITIVLSLQVDNNSQVFSSPPAGELEVLRRPPLYRCHPVDGLRTSSTDKADLYSLSRAGPARQRLQVQCHGQGLSDRRS